MKPVLRGTVWVGLILSSWGRLAPGASLEEVFSLESAKVGNATVYYDKSLAGALAFLEEQYGMLLEDARAQAKVRKDLLARSEEIIADINRILGASPDETQGEEQRRGLARLLSVRSPFLHEGAAVRFYLVDPDKVKAYMRRGGSLPGFSYDKAADQVTYLAAEELTRGEPESGLALCVPATDVEDARQIIACISQHLAILGFAPGLAIHEIVEYTILNVRLKPSDRHFRWFSDGFANAVAIRLLAKYLGAEAAAPFAQGYDSGPFRDLERELNLLYWTGADHSLETPLESERRLSQARYAYATLEATRLVEKHGIECVAAILDRACKGPRNSSADLIAAVQEVTGEDIAGRLRRYQTFQTPQEGMKKYSDRYEAAMAARDAAAALAGILRLHEVQPSLDLKLEFQAASILFHMGHEAAADRILLKRLAWLRQFAPQDSVLVFQQNFVIYALQCNNPQKAYPIADEVLEARPSFVPALKVRMDRLIRQGELDEAKKVARRIIDLEGGGGAGVLSPKDALAE